MAQRTKERTMLNIGVVGYGYWGPNIVRNFNAIEGVNVIGICDRNPEALKRARKAHPHIETCKDYCHITRSARVEAS
jgi:predicted dehydrogenase